MAKRRLTWGFFKAYGVWAGLGLVFVIATMLRLPTLGERSLSQDESTILEFTRGLLERGYPFLVRGDAVLPAATYELVPYFIAPAVALLGWSELSVRLAAALFGLATVALVFFAGRLWFDHRVGLWAALLYAVSPWAIYWSQNCFYPSQAQFFSMLATLFVYRLIRSPERRPWDYYLAALALCATYLTWEASGLLILAMGVLVLWMCRWHWDFLRSPHAWLALGVVATVVLGQLIRRGLLQTRYLTTGSSRAEISTPQLALGQTGFDPGYYLTNVFVTEQHLLLSVCFLAGLWYLRRDWNLRFVYGLAVLTVAFYTELLPVQAVRYLYLVLPIFLIGTAAATFRLLDTFVPVGDKGCTTRVRALFGIVGASLLTFQVVLLAVGGIGLTGFGEGRRDAGPWELNPSIDGIDFRRAAHALQSRYRDGDVVITWAPFLLHSYAGMKGDYGLQRVTRSIVVYDPVLKSPHYLDKWLGNPVLRSRSELEDVLHRHRRVWLLATPYESLRRGMGEELYAFVRDNFTVVDEGQHVRLYLWDRDMPNG